VELRRALEASEPLLGGRTGTVGDGAELQRLREENAQLHRDAERARHEAAVAQDAKTFATQEAETLRRTVAELRKAVSERDAQTAADALTGRYTGAAMDQWSAHESRVQVASQRGEIESLRQEITRLHRDLEQSMRETTAANDARLSAAQEAEQLRGRLRHSEEVSRATGSRLAEAESEVRRLTSRLSDSDSARTLFEQECGRLSTQLAIQEAEMAALIKAKEATPRKAVTFTSGGAHSGGRVAGSSAGGARLFQSPIRLRSSGQTAPGAGADLYEIASSGSGNSDSDDSGAVQPGRLTASAVKPLARSRKPSCKHSTLEASVISSRPLYGTYAEPQKFTVSDLEVAAAEVIALVLMQEIEANTPAEATAPVTARGSSTQRNTTNKSPATQSAFLKDACVRAALRVVHSSTTLARERLLEERQNKEAAEGGAGEGEGYRETMADVSRSSGEFDGSSESKRGDSSLGHSRYAGDASPSTHRSRAGGAHRGGGGKGKLGKVEIHPFQALGDHAFLCRVVADMHAGIAAIEEADVVKDEMRQTEVGPLCCSVLWVCTGCNSVSVPLPTLLGGDARPRSEGADDRRIHSDEAARADLT
jgi:predicted  nucleic acid-binding Zn-ribbon protein